MFDFDDAKLLLSGGKKALAMRRLSRSRIKHAKSVQGAQTKMTGVFFCNSDTKTPTFLKL